MPHPSPSRIADLHLAKTFTLNVGDPILYGKYKNKKGLIKGFKTGPKGDPIVLVEQVPNESGRKQDKELKLFKIRYDKARAEAMKKKQAAERVADRYAGVFEAPPKIMEAYLRWALPIYAGHVLYKAEQRRLVYQDRLAPLKEAQASLQASLRSFERDIKALKGGEVVWWPAYDFKGDRLIPHKVGVKSMGDVFMDEADMTGYLNDFSEKRLTFRKRKWPIEYDRTQRWVEEILSRNLRQITAFLEMEATRSRDDGPNLVEATLLVRAAKQYASKAKEYKSQTKTTLPLTLGSLQGWRYWDLVLEWMVVHHARVADTLKSAANMATGEYIWVSPHSTQAEALRYFGADPNDDITPAEARKLADTPFDVSKITALLKRKGWGSLNVVLVFKGHKSRGGVWIEGKKQLEVDVPFWGNPRTVAEFKDGIKEIGRIARHEFQHVGQDLLKTVTDSKEELGLPSKSMRDPERDPMGFPKKVDRGSRYREMLRDDHPLQDVEFYTRIADEIEMFTDQARQIPLDERRLALQVWTASSKEALVDLAMDTVRIRPRKFFYALKRKQPDKWKKAVAEFIKGLGDSGVKIPRASRVAARHLQALELLPIFDPAFNFREVCKQLALLEDHLLHPRKQCPDCIRKHLLTAEALAEEAVSLDEQHLYDDIHRWLAEAIRMVWRLAHREDVDPREAAKAARFIRKHLVPTAVRAKVGSA